MARAELAAGAERAKASGATQRAIVKLALADVFLSFTPVLFRWAELGPTTSAFYRAFLTIPVFGAWIVAERRGQGRSEFPRSTFPWSDAWLLVFAGAVFAAN